MIEASGIDFAPLPRPILPGRRFSLGGRPVCGASPGHRSTQITGTDIALNADGLGGLRNCVLLTLLTPVCPTQGLMPSTWLPSGGSTTHDHGQLYSCIAISM
jgi:hypothetical protein